MKLKLILIPVLLALSALIATGFAAYSSSVSLRQNQINTNGNHMGENHPDMINMDMEKMHTNMEQMHNGGMGQMMNETQMGYNQTRHGCH